MKTRAETKSSTHVDDSSALPSLETLTEYKKVLEKAGYLVTYAEKQKGELAKAIASHLAPRAGLNV